MSINEQELVCQKQYLCELLPLTEIGVLVVFLSAGGLLEEAQRGLDFCGLRVPREDPLV